MNPISLAFAVLATLASPQQRLPIRFLKLTSGSNVIVCIDSKKVEHVTAGKMGFTDGLRTWESLCCDVRSPVAVGQRFDTAVYHTGLAPANVRRAGNIVARWFASAQSSEACAALQLAVWEAIEDGGQHADFNQGRFQAQASPQVLRASIQFYEAQTTPGNAVLLRATTTSGQSQIMPRT